MLLGLLAVIKSVLHYLLQSKGKTEADVTDCLVWTFRFPLFYYISVSESLCQLLQNQSIGYKRRKRFLACEPNLDCFSLLQRSYLCCCEQQYSGQGVCCSILTGRCAFLKIVILLMEKVPSLCFYSDFSKILYSEAHFPYIFIHQILGSLSMIMCLIYLW